MADSITYTVVPGDTLSGIARRYGTTWQAIYALNRDIIDNPDLIFPGQVFRIPISDSDAPPAESEDPPSEPEDSPEAESDEPPAESGPPAQRSEPPARSGSGLAVTGFRVVQVYGGTLGGLQSEVAAAKRQNEDAARSRYSGLILNQPDYTRVEVVRPLRRPLPAGSYYISDVPGPRSNPLFFYQEVHTAMDYAAPTGTPIYAAHDGVVAEAGWLGGYGNALRLKGPDGLFTMYCHMSGPPRFGWGQSVVVGAVLGYVGATGNVTGPHLHFEVYKEVGGEKIYLIAEDLYG